MSTNARGTMEDVNILVTTTKEDIGAVVKMDINSKMTSTVVKVKYY